MLLNEKIAVIRKMNNLTQEQFAEELAVSRQAVSKWENGDSVPDIHMLTAIADGYNITLDQLIRNEYDLPHIGVQEDDAACSKQEDSPISIENYIGKICDVSMNSFYHSVIRNVEIIGMCGNMVCFLKNKKYGYFNANKTLGILVKKEGTGAVLKNELMLGKCTVYVNKGTYFGGVTYAFSAIKEQKGNRIVVATGKYETELSLDEVNVIFMSEKAK